jgi:CHASE3 domain sensor protein
MSMFVAMLLALAPQGNELERLEHLNPEVRLRAAEMAGQLQNTTAVSRLIGRLGDPDERVKTAAQKSLVAITGETGLADAAAWNAWWETSGKVRYPETPLAPAALLKKIDDRILRTENRTEDAKRDVRAIAITMLVAVVLFIIVMLFFVGHVSSKIKGWRELVGRAEIYVKHGQELTERTDKFAAELDRKKIEMAEFMEKLRKEHEEGIARRGDDLGTELAHQLRMELQTLRQKAERELDQTVTDLKTQVEAAARRAVSEMRDRLAK